MNPVKALVVAFICLFASIASAQSSLPANVREKILSDRVVTAFNASDYKGVLKRIDEAKGSGTDIPPPLLELEARAAYAVKETTRALKALERYLSEGEQSSPIYRAAVDRYTIYERGVEDTKAWNEAKGAATQESLMAYREKWPKGLYVEDITKTAEELEGRAWREALGKKQGWAFDRYSKAWPDGPHQAELVRERPRFDEEAWAEANRVKTSQAYDAYVENWPNGKYRSQAEQLSDDTHWERIKHSDSPPALRGYVNRKGTTRHAEDARVALARLDAVNEQEVIRIAQKILGTWSMVQVEQYSESECPAKDTTTTTFNFRQVDTTRRVIVGDVKRVRVEDWKQGYSCPDDETVQATFEAIVKFDRVKPYTDGPELSAETTLLGCSGSSHDSGCRFGSFTLHLTPAGSLSFTEYSDDPRIQLKKVN